METRPYFVFGDVVSNAGTGAVVAVVCQALPVDTWPMVLAMPLGMVVGSLVAMLLASALAFCFGAFEVMLPVMTTGMVVGMSTPLVGQTGPSVGVAAGAGLGLVVLVATYLLDARIRGRGEWTP